MEIHFNSKDVLRTRTCEMPVTKLQNNLKMHKTQESNMKSVDHTL